MKKVDINSLPKYSPYIEGLLGIKPFPKFTKNVKRGYNTSYSRLLQTYEQHPNLNFQELEDMYEGTTPESEICISIGDELFLTSPAAYTELMKQCFREKLAPYMADSTTVIELGCGWGYNLGLLREIDPAQRFIGGDFSKYALLLGQKVFSNFPEITIEQFNFYDKRWQILENLEGRALVFTSHAIEQLPLVKSIIANFVRYKQKITYVAHLEPIVELCGSDTLLDLMRRSYARATGYNSDLLSCIKSAGGKIIETIKDLRGQNPLNPTSFLVWKPQ